MEGVAFQAQPWRMGTVCDKAEQQTVLKERQAIPFNWNLKGTETKAQKMDQGMMKENPL